jgi:hypothetical protein
MRETSNILQATCSRCGGNPPVNLAAPIVCPYCGGIDTIEPVIFDRIKEVRERYLGRDKTLQQFGDRENIISVKYRRRVIRYLPFLVFFWTLVVAIAVGTAGEMLHHSRSLIGLLAMKGQSLNNDETLAWWLIYASALWFSFSFFIPSFSFFRVHRIIAGTRPLAPLASGEPPRCRNCMSVLPPSGTLRRCPACGTDHLVLDNSYQNEQASLDDAIRNAIDLESRSLKKQIARSENILGSAFLVALLGIFGAPVLGAILNVLIEASVWLFLLPAIFSCAMAGMYYHAWKKVRALMQKLDQTGS